MYALGVTAYRLVTGRYPPPGTDPECADDPGRPKPPPLRPPSELAAVGAELERLILKMLSPERAARGTAREVAWALEKAAMRLGPEGDSSIRPTSPPVSSRPAEKLQPRVRQARSDWVIRGLCAAGGLAFAGVWSLAHNEKPRPDPPPWLAEPMVPEERLEETEDATGVADAGVSDAVLASAVTKPRPNVSPLWIGRELPKKPFPGQSRPPCITRQIEIRGLCWWVFPAAKPPCEARNV